MLRDYPNIFSRFLKKKLILFLMIILNDPIIIIVTFSIILYKQ